jgi:glycolate oxidase subunit GlcD
MTPRTAPLLRELEAVLGTHGLLTDAAAREVYARDASHLTLGRPLAVALPRDAFELQRVVGACSRHGVPVVCRGTGTGLSGGAVPPEGAVVLATARLGRLSRLDPAGRTIHAEPGVLNDAVTRAAAPAGLHFAPDPSSQAAASIGGNIAENAGGPHCLRLGVTRRHLRRLDWVDASGRPWTTGRGLPVERGLDLLPLLCGSEGTLGVVTGADLALVPDPAEVATLLAFFPALDAATGAVVELLGAGLLPVAVEMVDRAMLDAVEEAFGFGFPTDQAAAMIAEFAGPAEEVAEDTEAARALLSGAGAAAVRAARDEDERAELWKCRKMAFGAVGRLAPSYVTMDVVVPLGRLPGLVAEIQEIKSRHRVEVATAFHAGDGNLHPGVHYDDRDPDETARAHAAADAIIRAALERGGSATGEHGVGIEKLHALPWQIDRTTAGLLRGIKERFDPDGFLNPGKALSDPQDDHAPPPPVPDRVEFRWADLTVTAPATTLLAELQAAARERGFQIPVGTGLGAAAAGVSVGELIDHLVPGPTLAAAGHVRDALLEIWASTRDGRRFHAGAPVVKNVAGYDLVGLVAGSGGRLARVAAATFSLRPLPRDLGHWTLEPRSGCPLAVVDDLVAELGGRDASLGGPVAIGETDGAGVTGPVHLLVPGRDRPWDLGAVGDRLRTLAALRVVAERVGTFAVPAPGTLPEWLDGGDWTLLGRPPGEPGGAALPRNAGRFIWQAAPRVVWWAGSDPECAGWHADRFRTAGRVSPSPGPGPGVPPELVRGLVELFDPAGGRGEDADG